MTVVVASHASELPRRRIRDSSRRSSPTGQPLTSLPLMSNESMRWQPELAPEGPLSAVLSRQSGRIIVYRAGVEIGRARVVFHGTEPVGTMCCCWSKVRRQTPQRYNGDSALRSTGWKSTSPVMRRRAGAEPDPSLAAAPRDAAGVRRRR